MAKETLSCPICGDVSADGAALALHVTSCSAAGVGAGAASPRASPSTAVLPACPLCHHVYAEGTPAHEVSFHEHECGRVNEPAAAPALSVTPSKKGKRSRAGEAAAVAAEPTPRVTLFPPNCFLCGQGGRGLLRCGGSCARACHAHCIEALQAPTVGEPLSVADKKAAADSWRCGECTRGLHRCQRCGFLGHESAGMRKCGVTDCGFFFHAHCLPSVAHTAAGPALLCPRHTCADCGAQEPDMRRCKSCIKCYTMTHLRCPRGATTTTGSALDSSASATPAQAIVSEAAALLDPGHLYVCAMHTAESVSSPAWMLRSPDATNSLRLRLAPGDVVLILEFANALLPPDASQSQPTAANHWGIVLSAEEMEPRGRGQQLLSVRTFADDRVLAVPNRYALRVAAAVDFERPADLILHCLQRHVMTELQLRHLAANVDTVTTAGILRASRQAFAARLKALRISDQLAKAEVERGLEHWRRFQALEDPRLYDGLGDTAPVYLFLDTRSSQQRQAQDGSSTANGFAEGGAASGNDGDVDMANGDANSSVNGSASAPGSTSGSGFGSVISGLSAGRHALQNAMTEAEPREEVEAHTDVEDGHEEIDGTPVETLNAVNMPVMEELNASDLTPTVAGEQESEQPATGTENQEMVHDSQHEAASLTVVSEPLSTQEAPKVVSVVVAVEEGELMTEDTQEEPPTQVAVSVSSPASAVDVASVQNVSNKRSTDNVEASMEASVKRQKLDATMQTPKNSSGLAVNTAASQNGISPVASATRTKSSLGPKQPRKTLTRKQKMLAEMPPLVLAELQLEAARFLERADGPSHAASTETRMPTDSEAFPWAARTARSRPAFYRPNVMLSHPGARRTDVTAVSRLLVSQDKRSVKCFIQTIQAGSEALVATSPCLHRRQWASGASPAFVLLDLMSLGSVRAVERVVRVRMVDALTDRARYTQEIFGMEARQVRRWLEQQHRKPVREQLQLSLWACSVDGSRRRLEQSPPGQQAQQWLCLCANVCHLTAVISLPRMDSVTPASTSAIQQPARQTMPVGTSAM